METHHDQHVSPIQNWKQLVIVVALAFIVPIAVIALVTQLVTGGGEPVSPDDHGTIERIKPVGNVVLAAPSGPKGQLTGEQVYGQVCKTCHEAGLAGAPKVGDAAAWAPRVKQGESTLFAHAVDGIRAMPPKGGNPDLEPVEVQRAVVFMANKSGANLKEPAAPPAAKAGGDRTGEQVVASTCGKCHTTGERGAPKIGDRAAWIQRAKRGLQSVYESALRGHAGMPARGGMAELSDVEVKRAVEFMMNSGAATAPTATVAQAAPATAAPAAAPASTAAAAPAAAAGKADGKKIYDTTCMACHGAGLVGAPKFGDKAAWAPRIAQGEATLYNSALKGKNAMPPKGGNNALNDDDVKAAVDYMTAAAK